MPGDKSPFGVMDIAGGVREWVDNVTGPYAIQRGGYYNDNSDEAVRISQRNREPAQWGWQQTGFRCAKSGVPTVK